MLLLCSCGFVLPSLALRRGPVSWTGSPRDGARAACAEARIRIVANADLTAADRSIPQKGNHGCPPGGAEEENQAEPVAGPQVLVARAGVGLRRNDWVARHRTAVVALANRPANRQNDAGLHCGRAEHDARVPALLWQAPEQFRGRAGRPTHAC